MQVRVFEAKDMASGLKLVKEALGPDALILSTRTIRGGKFGVIGKPILEITAAIDDQWPEPAPRTAAASRSEQPRREETREPWPPARAERFGQRRDNPYAAVQQAQNRPMFVEPPAERSQPGEDIQNELAELRNMVKGLSNRITGLDASALRKPYVEPEFAATATGGVADPVIGYLTGFGINQETAQVVARFTRDAVDQAAGMDNADLAAVFKAAIARLFTTELACRRGAAGHGGGQALCHRPEVAFGRRMPLDSEALDRLLGSAWYSPAKIARELGWRARVRLDDGLREMFGC